MRSFRSADPHHLIRNGHSSYRLLGRIGLVGGYSIPLGMQRLPGSYRIHLEGRPVQRLSDLAGCFPVQVLTNDTANILSGGPAYRRQSLDWAFFHVEQRYRELWQRYARVLRQRNAALRTRTPRAQITAWDKELADAAAALDRSRRIYLSDLEPFVQREFAALLPGRSLILRYFSGWAKEAELDVVLKRTFEKDFSRGYTQSGPHRADLAALVDGTPAQLKLSRGQQKALVVAFLLGQAKLQQSVNGPRGAFLLDDLGSELDAEHQVRILSCLREIGSQVFVTAIGSHSVNLSDWPVIKTFHVEHGVVREML